VTREQETVYLFLTEHPAEYGQMLGYKDLRPDLHGMWMHDMLLTREDMTLQSHRGSYKTTCLGIVLAIMMMLRGDLNIIFLRKTDTDITEVIKQVHRILTHEVTQALYKALTGAPLLILKSTNSEITTSAYTAPRGAAQLLGIGIGGSITGKHADLIVTDDIVNLSDRLSHAERERTKSAYQELLNVCNRGGRFINTGTPWHKDDAFTIMPPARVYDCYSTGLITPEKLEQLKRSMAPTLFAANYELKHIAAEDALFTGYPQKTTDETLFRDGIAHVDAAYGGEDFTALTCAKRDGDTLYLYGRLWRGHVDTLMDAIISACDGLMCAPIYCETNGDKGYLGRELRRRGAEVHMYQEKQNKYAKISTFLRKWWGNIVFLDGTDRAYIDQIMDYTETAAHDDAPDSAACVCRILDRRE
jgi:hypothetical protein